MKIVEIYKKYKINKGLQEHMLRVAAVAQMICDNSKVELDTENVVTACLVHDMGNLIKAKMDSFPEFFDPEGLDYWSQVKDEMTSKYGDVDTATAAMIDDMHLVSEAQFYYKAIGGEPTGRVCDTGTLGEKISNYSDMRVGPHQVISLQQRMDDIRDRYLVRNMEGFGVEEINEHQRCLVSMESDIFTNSNILPEDITVESMAEIQKKLLNFEIET